MTEPDRPADDGRRWWFVTGKLWPGAIPYTAKTERSALAAYRRDLIEAEVYNGRSRREATEWVRGAGLHVDAGPFTTPDAFDHELGWALAWEICEFSSDVPMAPATAAEFLARGMTEQRLSLIRENVVKAFAPEGDTGQEKPHG